MRPVYILVVSMEKKLTLSAYTITGRANSLHCGPEINIQGQCSLAYTV